MSVEHEHVSAFLHPHLLALSAPVTFSHIFLCKKVPTIALAKQQARACNRDTGLAVSACTQARVSMLVCVLACIEDDADHVVFFIQVLEMAGNHVVLHHIGKEGAFPKGSAFHVIVATAQSVVNALGKKVDLRGVSLIVLDEAHHVLG